MPPHTLGMKIQRAPETAAPDWPCRLCGSRKLRLYYTQGNRDEFRYYRCPDCGLVNYDLAGGLDQGKYEDDMPDPRDPAPRKNRAQTETWRFLARHLAPPGRLLEIGCGNGRLLHLAREAGWTVAGLELSRPLAESVVRNLDIPVTVANIFEPGLAARLGAGRHDVIVLRHVLEHLPEPNAVMALFRDLLAGHGHVVFEFPNIEGLGFQLRRALDKAGLRRKAYRADYRPGHCNEYCRASFGQLAERNGFEVLAWETYSHNPAWDRVVNRWPFGIKARTLIRKR